MIQSDDIAIAYERLICICCQCKRREIASADADVFRGLQSKYALAVKSGDWGEYSEKEKIVLSYIKEALDANDTLETNNYIKASSEHAALGLDVISYIVGRILEAVKK